jgi:hypothetical protein
MFEFLIVVIILIILLFALWKWGLLPSLPAPYSTGSINNFTSVASDKMLDLRTYNQYYAGRRNQLNMARLEREKDNILVALFMLVNDASNKGKKFVAYKDLPQSTTMYNAFVLLNENPEYYFEELAQLSMQKNNKPYEGFAGNDDENNLGLHIENVPEKTGQYLPRAPSSAWKYIERSRGPH